MGVKASRSLKVQSMFYLIANFMHFIIHTLLLNLRPEGPGRGGGVGMDTIFQFSHM